MPLGSTTYQKGKTETINKVTSVSAFYQIPEGKERGKMKNTLIIDAKTAINLFGKIRKARKAGIETEVHEVEVKRIPVISVPGFYDTVEGCVFANCANNIHETAKNVYKTFTNEKKGQLAFSPKDGEFIDRVNFWKDVLKPVLPPKQYNIAVQSLLHWYIHIKNLGCKEVVGCQE